MQEIKKGEILGFEGSWGSGIGYLLVRNLATGQIERCTCENAPTVRSLQAALGNAIGEGHTISQNAGFVGKIIYYGAGEWLGVGWFCPEDEADFELTELYEKQFEKPKKTTKKRKRDGK